MSICALMHQDWKRKRDVQYNTVLQDVEKYSPTLARKGYNCESSGSLSGSEHDEDEAHLTNDSNPSSTFFWRNTLLDRNNLKLLLPALLFVFQNNLQIISGSYLDSTEFQVLSQLKIVTAAVSSILILKKKLLFQHWASIGLLLVGIALVQQSTASNQTSASISGHDLPQAFIIGLMAMLGACCFSGVASVTIEYLLKNETGFWVSNLLLATYSILPASFIILADCARSGHFQPYRYFNLAAWLSIILNAIGGILVSVVMKYADNILKGFAVSGALIATVSINAIASDRGIPWKRIFASLVVVGSMYLYGSKSTVNVVETRTSTEQHVNLDLLDDPH